MNEPGADPSLSALLPNSTHGAKLPRRPELFPFQSVQLLIIRNSVSRLENVFISNNREAIVEHYNLACKLLTRLRMIKVLQSEINPANYSVKAQPIPNLSSALYTSHGKGTRGRYRFNSNPVNRDSSKSRDGRSSHLTMGLALEVVGWEAAIGDERIELASLLASGNRAKGSSSPPSYRSKATTGCDGFADSIAPSAQSVYRIFSKRPIWHRIQRDLRDILDRYETELSAIRPYLGVLDPAFYTHSNLELQAIERLQAIPAQFVRLGLILEEFWFSRLRGASLAESSWRPQSPIVLPGLASYRLFFHHPGERKRTLLPGARSAIMIFSVALANLLTNIDSNSAKFSISFKGSRCQTTDELSEKQCVILSCVSIGGLKLRQVLPGVVIDTSIKGMEFRDGVPFRLRDLLIFGPHLSPHMSPHVDEGSIFVIKKILLNFHLLSSWGAITSTGNGASLLLVLVLLLGMWLPIVIIFTIIIFSFNKPYHIYDLHTYALLVHLPYNHHPSNIFLPLPYLLSLPLLVSGSLSDGATESPVLDLGRILLRLVGYNRNWILPLEESANDGIPWGILQCVDRQDKCHHGFLFDPFLTISTVGGGSPGSHTGCHAQGWLLLAPGQAHWKDGLKTIAEPEVQHFFFSSASWLASLQMRKPQHCYSRMQHSPVGSWSLVPVGQSLVCSVVPSARMKGCYNSTEMTSQRWKEKPIPSGVARNLWAPKIHAPASARFFFIFKGTDGVLTELCSGLRFLRLGIGPKALLLLPLIDQKRRQVVMDLRIRSLRQRKAFTGYSGRDRFGIGFSGICGISSIAELTNFEIAAAELIVAAETGEEARVPLIALQWLAYDAPVSQRKWHTLCRPFGRYLLTTIHGNCGRRSDSRRKVWRPAPGFGIS
ncbi:hypothetical protein M5K25_018994 [Dendrobium thyrsiflorum]|uniref:Uncharacterized protein n=1 Tax=Dendrobium thyrsiflorum TaxID=117978 RepID=A0ABD0UDW2_DENTH